MTTLSVIIPANNEEDYIGACLDSLRLQNLDATDAGYEIVVAANACRDGTTERANAAREGLETTGWRLHLLDIPEPGKLNALNRAEEIASGRVLVYLDADVRCEPDIIRLLVHALDIDAPRYASGHLKVAPAQSWVTRAFARVWEQLPFMTTNVQGAGLFAVNRAGRARWGTFPDIIADDGFVRLQFTPEERVKVDATYHWPMVEGFSNLVNVRRRQDAGVRQLASQFPELLKNESKPAMTFADHLRLLLRMPVSYLIYVSVIARVRLSASGKTDWVRGR